MTIKLLILDLDGPILDGRIRHYQCYKNIIESFGFPAIDIDIYWSLKRNRVNRTELLKLSGAEHLYDQFLEKWMDSIESKEYLTLDIIQAGALETLKNWRIQGVKLILATMRNNAEHLTWQLKKFGILEHLDHVVVVGSALDGENKAEAVAQLIKNWDLETIAWIGDTEVDMSSAKKIGVKSVAITKGLRSTEYLQSLHPDFLMHSISEFSNALQ